MLDENHEPMARLTMIPQTKVDRSSHETSPYPLRPTPVPSNPCSLPPSYYTDMWVVEDTIHNNAKGAIESKVILDVYNTNAIIAGRTYMDCEGTTFWINWRVLLQIFDHFQIWALTTFSFIQFTSPRYSLHAYSKFLVS